MVPRGFKPNEVASFTILGPEKRLVSEVDVSITQNGEPIVLEAEGYYYRTESLLGFEVQWTNGNHLQWPSRGRLRELPFDNSDSQQTLCISTTRSEMANVSMEPRSTRRTSLYLFRAWSSRLLGLFVILPNSRQSFLGNYERDQDAFKVSKDPCH